MLFKLLFLQGTDYSNLVFLRNFKDRDLIVQVQMDFYDSSGNVMDTIETGSMTIGANETIPFLPNTLTRRDQSLWNRFTIDTDDRTGNIQYRYRYKDAN